MRTDIDKLIAGYLRKDLSEQDRQKISFWLEQNPLNKDQLEALSKIWETPLDYSAIINAQEERQKIRNRLYHDPGKLILKRAGSAFAVKKVLRYAAAIVFFIGLGYVFWLNRVESDENEPIVQIVERRNPLGQKSRIQLPDGSKVWLNADSKLSYTTDFNRRVRKVSLEGEAYFEVAKSHNTPFEVYTNDLVITALGTSFNVHAFSPESEKVALNTGKVKIECIDDSDSCPPSYLNPGDLALYDNSSGKISMSEYLGLDPFGWKDGRIVFHHATFDEVLVVLERWFNVDFEVEGALRQEWNYSTTFENETLENILMSLQFSEKIEYEITDSVIKIKL
ncbi:MAG: FecR domain-containing protein [Cytophagales bacterium]|nr:FecR domain-containing protein [Cytophagales bacterium]